MPAYRSGPKRHRIEIQAPPDPEDSANQDDLGQPVADFTTVATRWGSIEPIIGREAWQAQQAVSQVSHRIRIRYYSGTFDPSYRLKFGTRYFGIETIRNLDERKVEMEVMVKEKTT